MRWAAVLAALALAACGSRDGGTGSDAASTGVDSSGGGGTDAQQQGCGGLPNCYSVYAHSNTVLYVVDLMAKTLVRVGPFNAPNNDVMTDLAVAPNGTIYTISATKIYTASATDGHVTLVGSLSTCGSFGVALTTLPNGEIWTGDFAGKLCRIDISTMPPTVGAPVTMSNGMALSGDLVAIGDGTVFGTAYKLSDPPNGGTQVNNVLVTIDVTTGAVTQKGPTGYPKLFGTSFSNNHVIGFTHDGTGHVIETDPATGTSTLFATFNDPQSGTPISFAGAGVNSLVSIIL